MKSVGRHKQDHEIILSSFKTAVLGVYMQLYML